MDPFSCAASIFAVASLAVQLVQSVDNARAFIRNFSGASGELQRLSQLLDRLRALLQDVRDVIERQSSLQHFPLPSNTIFSCLNSCRISLVSVEDAIKCYDSGQPSNNKSAVKRLHLDVKFGFKAKNIRHLEQRLQQDINDLNTALGMNTVNILTTVLPFVLSKQCESATRQPAQHTNYWTKSLKCETVSRRDLHTPGQRLYISRQEWIQSPLHWLGIRRRRTTRYLIITAAGVKQTSANRTQTISEIYEIFVIWQLLGYGFHCRREYPFGSILPSLRVYPIVNRLWQYYDLLCLGSLHEIQQAFASGQVHPFVVDVNGYTLLHLAAVLGKPQLCRLLLDYGLKPEFTSFGLSPLSYCVANASFNYSVSSIIDTLRILLSFFSQTGDPRQGSEQFYCMSTNLDATEWLWVNAAFATHRPDHVGYRVEIAQALVRCYCLGEPRLNDAVNKMLTDWFNAEMVQLYVQGHYALLPGAFMYMHSSIESTCAGWNFLQLLATLGLDVDTCVQRELQSFPKSFLLHDDAGIERRRTVIFEKLQDGSPVLRWEWAYDALASGYLLASEFNALAGDADPYWAMSEWPFEEFNWQNYESEDIAMAHYNFTAPQQLARYHRRVATKIRKERARSGRKRSRRKMPGSWIQ